MASSEPPPDSPTDGAGASPKRARRPTSGGQSAATPPSKAFRPATRAGCVRLSAAIACPAPEAEATELELPRNAVGLNTLYTAMAADEQVTLACERGRWICDPESGATRVVAITAKDQYETPGYVWRRLVALEAIDYDACATPLSAVSRGLGGGGLQAVCMRVDWRSGWCQPDLGTTTGPTRPLAPTKSSALPPPPLPLTPPSCRTPRSAGSTARRSWPMTPFHDSAPYS
jgi:hypothetical protein